MVSFRIFAPVCLVFLLACAHETSTNGTSGAGGTSGSSNSSSSSSTSSSSSVVASSSSSSGEGGGPPAQSVSLLTLNLHCLRLDGTIYATNADRFKAIASLVAERDVSAIALQEACQRPGENAIEELRAAIESATASAWSSTWTFAHVAWEGTPDQADEGVGLLVKGALTKPTELVLAVQGSLRRVATSATLPTEWSGIRLTSVHFEVFESAARTMQAREVAASALVATDPDFGAIVAGDFNDIEGSTTYEAFPAMGYLAATAGIDPQGIDHVMLHRATKWRSSATEKVFLGADAVSDHPGILVRFEPAPGDAVFATRIDAQANPATNQFLAIRGNLTPLSWDLGFPMVPISAGQYRFVATEISGNFEFKTLLDDLTWQTGANEQGKGGTTQIITPMF